MMMTPTPLRHEDSFFNDLSRQPTAAKSPTEQVPNRDNVSTNAGEPRPKRIACVICRKRKLKCDGSKPNCGTCSRLGHNCAYDEVRRKSGPKRGYVKELEARLAQVETQLKTKDHDEPKGPEPVQTSSGPAPFITKSNFDEGGLMSFSESDQLPMDGLWDSNALGADLSMEPSSMPSLTSGESTALDDAMSWEMIGLGLEEPLPTQEAIDELTQIYFEKIHPSLPMIQKYRFYTSMNLAPHMRAPVCLRYAMWALAATLSEKYVSAKEIFYRRARKYAEADEMRGAGEGCVSVRHAQTWTLICTYEFKMMYFPRAWQSVGRAVRLVLMMGLNRLDGVGMDVKQCLDPPRDWTEREERRRTFWQAYCVDRYASIGTGWPMAIDERDILTNLPATESAFENSMPEKTSPLMLQMKPQDAAALSPLAGVIFMAHFFGWNLTHLHRPEPNDNEGDIQGEFWKRHRSLDNTLLNTSLALPQHLKLPSGIRDVNVVFLNMAIHTSTICLHQAAIFKGEKNNLPASFVDQSKTRCILAAAEITTIMRLISHFDLSTLNPFTAFCLYVSARVFVQFLKKTPQDQEVRSSLEFLLAAMEVLKRTNLLTESFLIQLSLDLEGTGLDALLHNPDRSTIRNVNSKMPGGIDDNGPHFPPDFTCSSYPGTRTTTIDAQSSTIPPDFANSPMEMYPKRNVSGQSGPDPKLGVFDLPTGGRKPPQRSPETAADILDVNLHGILPGHDNGWDGNALSGRDPRVSRQETRSDFGSNDQSSSRPTPSSHSSFSPPADDSPQMRNMSPPGNSAGQSPAASHAPFYAFGNLEQNYQNTQQPRDNLNGARSSAFSGFSVSADWQVGGDLNTTNTGVSASGLNAMSPGLQGWSQGIDQSGWDRVNQQSDPAAWGYKSN